MTDPSPYAVGPDSDTAWPVPSTPSPLGMDPRVRQVIEPVASPPQVCPSETCEHHWVAKHFPGARVWITQCSLCDTINVDLLNEEVDELIAKAVAAPGAGACEPSGLGERVIAELARRYSRGLKKNPAWDRKAERKAWDGGRDYEVPEYIQRTAAEKAADTCFTMEDAEDGYPMLRALTYQEIGAVVDACSGGPAPTGGDWLMDLKCPRCGGPVWIGYDRVSEEVYPGCQNIDACGAVWDERGVEVEVAASVAGVTESAEMLGATIVHACPPDGSGITPRCGRTPFELDRTSRMTVDSDLVTCGAGASMADSHVADPSSKGAAQVAAGIGDLRTELARLRVGADDSPATPGAWPTPGQWIARFLALGESERLAFAAQAMKNAEGRALCMEFGHAGHIAWLEAELRRRPVGAAEVAQ